MRFLLKTILGCALSLIILGEKDAESQPPMTKVDINIEAQVTQSGYQDYCMIRVPFELDGYQLAKQYVTAFDVDHPTREELDANAEWSEGGALYSYGFIIPRENPLHKHFEGQNFYLITSEGVEPIEMGIIGNIRYKGVRPEDPKGSRVSRKSRFYGAGGFECPGLSAGLIVQSSRKLEWEFQEFSGDINKMFDEYFLAIKNRGKPVVDRNIEQNECRSTISSGLIAKAANVNKYWAAFNTEVTPEECVVCEVFHHFFELKNWDEIKKNNELKNGEVLKALNSIGSAGTGCDI